MTVAVHGLTPAQETALLTLYGRALDRQSPTPVLNDGISADIVEKLNYDFKQMKVLTATRLQIAFRAKGLDRRMRECLARHPDAVAMDLGAGLDTRVFRVDPPTTVDWYDVDFPNLMEIRQAVMPHRLHARIIGASLADPHWLDGVPTGRHTVIVMEAVLPFLSHEEIVTLFDLVISHFPSGDVIFNGYPGFSQRWAKFSPALKGIVAAERSETFTDPRVPESWHPRLKLVEEVLLSRDPESTKDLKNFPFLLRILSRPASLTPSLARIGPRVLHYRF